ncbi:MAG: hypothetical protein K6G80_04115 [Treponema sp.]|nr:hypothetical protein [Treponema sp.]
MHKHFLLPFLAGAATLFFLPSCAVSINESLEKTNHLTIEGESSHSQANTTQYAVLVAVVSYSEFNAQYSSLSSGRYRCYFDFSAEDAENRRQAFSFSQMSLNKSAIADYLSGVESSDINLLLSSDYGWIALRPTGSDVVKVLLKKPTVNYTTGGAIPSYYWTTGTFTSSESEHIYVFYPSAGATYRLFWDDSYEGSGTTTVDITAWCASFTYASSTAIDNGYKTPQEITTYYSNPIYIKVKPYNSGSTGRYRICLLDSNSEKVTLSSN